MECCAVHTLHTGLAVNGQFVVPALVLGFSVAFTLLGILLARRIAGTPSTW